MPALCFEVLLAAKKEFHAENAKEQRRREKEATNTCSDFVASIVNSYFTADGLRDGSGIEAQRR